jgi:hypothetical protein
MRDPSETSSLLARRSRAVRIGAEASALLRGLDGLTIG